MRRTQAVFVRFPWFRIELDKVTSPLGQTADFSSNSFRAPHVSNTETKNLGLHRRPVSCGRKAAAQVSAKQGN